MSLKYAILGFLSLEGMSGYTLKTKYFDRSVAHFWPADQAQIYRTLQKLEKDGLATSAEIDNKARPSQKIYCVTKLGSQDLKKWLSLQHPPNALRSTFLVQIYFSRLSSSEDFLTLLESERRRQKDALSFFENIDLDTKSAKSEALSHQTKFGQLTIDYAFQKTQMEIEWLDKIISEINLETKT